MTKIDASVVVGFWSLVFRVNGVFHQYKQGCIVALCSKQCFIPDLGDMIELTVVDDLRSDLPSAISTQVAVNSQGVASFESAFYEICNFYIDRIYGVEAYPL